MLIRIVTTLRQFSVLHSPLTELAINARYLRNGKHLAQMDYQQGGFRLRVFSKINKKGNAPQHSKRCKMLRQKVSTDAPNTLQRALCLLWLFWQHGAEDKVCNNSRNDARKHRDEHDDHAHQGSVNFKVICKPTAHTTDQYISARSVERFRATLFFCAEHDFSALFAVQLPVYVNCVLRADAFSTAGTGAYRIAAVVFKALHFTCSPSGITIHSRM